MRIAIQQSAGVAGDIAANLAILRCAAAAAAQRGARLLILPELFLTGYNLGERLRELAEPLEGPTMQTIADAARSAGLAILTGFCERDGALIRNSAVLVERDGSLAAVHRKCHLYGPMEKAMFAPGDALAAATLDGLRIGILICYDVEFPEAVRAHALAGAALVAVPTALMHPHDSVARQMVPTRAFENQIFLAYANRVGAENGVRYVGQSCLVGPDGRDLARADAVSEQLLVADIDPSARRALDYARDRRPELYGSLTETALPKAAATG